METNKTANPSKSSLGWVLLAIGLVLIAVGVAIRLLAPNFQINPKWFESFGILFTGLSVVYLARFFKALRNPRAARQAQLAEEDERSTAIRQRAGNAAFTFMMFAAGIGLLIYSNLTAGQTSFDPMWLFLAFLVIGPSAFYIAYLLYLQSRY